MRIAAFGVTGVVTYVRLEGTVIKTSYILVLHKRGDV